MATVVETHLPKSGEGYVGYKPDKTRWGTAATVRFVVGLAAEWKAHNSAGPRGRGC